jgi:predicted nucleic acid-binding protein
LLKKISQDEAEKLLKAMFAIVEAMNVVLLEGEGDGNAVLAKACEFSITFYDSAYVSEAFKSKKILVTDDKKLAKVAQQIGVKTLTSKDLIP